MATRAVPALIRVAKHQDRDRPARLLEVATRVLPPARREWGAAMRAELDQITEETARWRFSAGCGWAALVVRSRSREPGGEKLRAVVFTGIAASLGLGLYGVVRYPGLRSGYHLWSSLAVLVFVLGVYATATVMLSRGGARKASLARNYGVTGGAVIGIAWVAALLPTPAMKSFVIVPLVVALLGPVGVAALASRAARDRRTGRLAGLWTAVVGGLTVFTIWVTVTYVTNGRPYDPGLVRDFHHSGAADLATYAVSDDLGSGLVLLLLVPTVALALGSLGARLGEQRG